MVCVFISTFGKVRRVADTTSPPAALRQWTLWNLRIEIGQVKEPSRDSDGQPLTVIEAEGPRGAAVEGLF